MQGLGSTNRTEYKNVLYRVDIDSIPLFPTNHQKVVRAEIMGPFAITTACLPKSNGVAVWLFSLSL